MNKIRKWLAEGDLTSDGRANDVVQIINKNPEKIDDLLACLEDQDKVIRGHAADAIEKVGREKPEIYLPYMHILLERAIQDDLPMVQWHLAMLFGHLAIYEALIDPIISVLLDLLTSVSAMTVTWSMASLCIIAKLHPGYSPRVLGEISQFEESTKVSIKSRSREIKQILLEDKSIPKHWVKSPAVQAKLEF
jgi:hypothetical protein